MEFVILATDGVWDALQEQTVLTTARKVLRETRSSEAAAQAVLESAGRVSKADNAAVIVLAINIPEPPPKREPGQWKFEAWLQNGVRLILCICIVAMSRRPVSAVPRGIGKATFEDI